MKDNLKSKKGVVNLKNEMFVDITKPIKKNGDIEPTRISARVTIGDSNELFNEVDIKIKSLKFKKVLKGNVWYIAMVSLNKILDHVDPSDVSKNEDLKEFIENLIDEAFDKE